MHHELIPYGPSIQQEVAKKQAKEKNSTPMYMVNFMKPSLNKHKVDITRWLCLNVIPFNVCSSSEFWAIYKEYYDNYSVISRITFNNNVLCDYRRFVIACAEKWTHGIHQHYGESFLHVMHDMVMLNDRKNYLGASVSFMVYFYLYRLAVTLIPNNVINSSNYNADLLKKIFKETFELDIYLFTKSMASDTNNLKTAVARFFSPRDVQVNCEMHQLNSCLSMALEFARITRARTY